MKEPPHPLLAGGKVRHVGDPVAMVIADSVEAARSAAVGRRVGHRAHHRGGRGRRPHLDMRRRRNGSGTNGALRLAAVSFQSRLQYPSLNKNETATGRVVLDCNLVRSVLQPAKRSLRDTLPARWAGLPTVPQVNFPASGVGPSKAGSSRRSNISSVSASATKSLRAPSAVSSPSRKSAPVR
jgi:hypothetical protein